MITCFLYSKFLMEMNPVIINTHPTKRGRDDEDDGGLEEMPRIDSVTKREREELAGRVCAPLHTTWTLGGGWKLRSSTTTKIMQTNFGNAFNQR